MNNRICKNCKHWDNFFSKDSNIGECCGVNQIGEDEKETGFLIDMADDTGFSFQFQTLSTFGCSFFKPREVSK